MILELYHPELGKIRSQFISLNDIQSNNLVLIDPLNNPNYSWLGNKRLIIRRSYFEG